MPTYTPRIYPHRPTPSGYIDPPSDILRRKPTEPAESYINRMVDAQLSKLCSGCQTIYEYRRPHCPNCNVSVNRLIQPRPVKATTRSSPQKKRGSSPAKPTTP